MIFGSYFSYARGFVNFWFVGIVTLKMLHDGIEYVVNNEAIVI